MMRRSENDASNAPPQQEARTHTTACRRSSLPGYSSSCSPRTAMDDGTQQQQHSTPIRRHSHAMPRGKSSSPWEKRKRAICQRRKTLPIIFPSSLDDQEHDGPLSLHNTASSSSSSCSTWDQRKSALLQKLNGNSPKSRPKKVKRVRSHSSSNNNRKEKTTTTTSSVTRSSSSRWESEPWKVDEKQSESNNSSRWESSPRPITTTTTTASAPCSPCSMCSSSQQQRGRRASAPVLSPRLPKRQVSRNTQQEKPKVPSPFLRKNNNKHPSQ